MFGIIIHYGLYSFYAYDDVKLAKRRKIKNGSEWYYGRLIDNNTFRPISGQSQTKEFHKENYDNQNYFDNLHQIVNDEIKIKEWITQCKKFNAKYIILTSKHHDGVCLWNTKTTNKKSDLNILEIFKNECLKQSIDFGFYYSWLEFDKNFTLDYFNNVCVQQINELLLFNPKYIWFDGDWKITQVSIKKKIKIMCEILINKGIIINDRTGNDNNINSYRVFSDRYIPEKKLDIKWQHINTIGYSWGFNKMQKDTDYKSGKEIYDLYCKVTSLNGDFLLNIGPEINGDICAQELISLNDFSNLMMNPKKLKIKSNVV